MRVLITGGAGFVGSSLALGLRAAHPDWEVLALDNLRRRGSELNLPRLAEAGVSFVHGDVREPSDLGALPRLDAVVECSAEPSALAGTTGSMDYLVGTNLTGAHHCFELARRDGAQVVFLSTSRVYPYEQVNALPFRETATRFELEGHGVGEDLPLDGPRTPYGATKLAAELLLLEQRAVGGMPTVVNRCGVLAGPWQMGKVDQGVFTWWALAHVHHRPLRYIGFGGEGKQVRDLLHVTDLVTLVDEQLQHPERFDGAVVNVGGGREVSLSLAEATALCAELTGNEVPVDAAEGDRHGDVRAYISDCRRLHELTDWRPSRDAREVLADTVAWLQDEGDRVLAALA